MSRRRLEPDGDDLVLRLLPQERDVLAALVADVDAALDGPTDDDVVARLFPPVVEGDDEADAEMRALFAGDLLLERHDAMAGVRALLDAAVPWRRGGWLQVRLDATGASLLLGVLNDLRLAIAARIGEDVVLAADEAEEQGVIAALDTMEWLGGLQSLLLREL